jgi:hypothetical protein
MVYSGKERDGSSKPVVTKGTAAVYATNEGLCIASRNIDAGKVMDAAMTVIFDPEATATARRAAKKDIETVRAYLNSSGGSLATAVNTVKNVLKGWIESGLVDEETKRFPCLYKILGTCKKRILKSTVDQITADFSSLLNEVDCNGRVSED